MLAMFHIRQEIPLGGAVALQLVRDDHPGHVGQALEQLPEECLGGVLVPSTLDQDIQDVAVLIHGTPQIVPFAVNRVLSAFAPNWLFGVGCEAVAPSRGE
jgi:hypothetical protein